MAHIWDLWIPEVGARGASFGRSRIDATDMVLVHAAPDQISVDVFTDDGHLVARGERLPRTAYTPMCRLRLERSDVTRDDIWPDSSDVGRPVLLMGGEAGILQRWWNAADEQEWRWSVELYNHR